MAERDDVAFSISATNRGPGGTKSMARTTTSFLPEGFKERIAAGEFLRVGGGLPGRFMEP